ncbi:MAG TPA: hypothetical protein VFV58_07240 [Blastocatellia bacterium]|jgi:hypothetical protein|nr:hypothetical protein [Blastocatellia bacterium]
MSSEIGGSKTQVIVAVITLIGVIGGALITNWDKLFPNNQAPTTGPTPGIEEKSSNHTPGRSDGNGNVPMPSPLPTAEIDISGVWRDALGFTSQITQQGSTFKYTAWGAACRGNFQSSGSGTIKGNIVESDYQSNYSQGHCSGTVSSDGRRITSICTDSVCGQFQSSVVRQ